MSKGYVYILSNPSMPGLVKIGKTTRTPVGRADELYQTGVPTPFVVEYSILSPDCHRLESDMHDRFAECRVSDCREFFAVDDIDMVVESLRDARLSQLQEFVWSFDEHLSVAYRNKILDDDLLRQWSSGLDGADVEHIACAVRNLRPKEISHVVVEVQEWAAKTEADGMAGAGVVMQ